MRDKEWDKEDGGRRKEKEGELPSTLYAPLITFSIALFVYLLTMPSGLTFAHHGADGGELIAAAVTLGVPHPPGYPTYILVGKLISLLPVGSVAYRFNLLSALCMAATAAIITLVAMRSSRRLAGMTVGLLFAFAPLVWSQAIITEVYALNALLLALTLWQLAPEEPNPTIVGLLLGLSMTTHLTSALMLPLVLWRFRPKKWPLITLGLLLGLTPFLLLPLFAAGTSPIVWGDVSTVSGWWWVVSGTVYRPNLLSHPTFPRLTQAIMPTLQQFSYVGWAAFAVALKQSMSQHNQKTLHPIALASTALLYAVYALKYDAVDAVVNAVPALILCAIALAPALNRLGVFAVLLPLVTVALNFNAVNLHNDVAARQLISQSLQSIPENAVIITGGDDQTIFSLWYAQSAERQRQDVVLVDKNLFAFDWYRHRLARLNDDLVALAVDDVENFIEKNGLIRPICTVSFQNMQANSCTLGTNP